jgi:hypothetical protein
VAGKVELYQIYFDDRHIDRLYPFAIPFKNENLTPFFENSIISKLVKATDADKIGVCSWRLREKQRSNIPPKREVTEELLNSDYDVLSLTKNSSKHLMLEAAEAWHPGFIEILHRIGHTIGQVIPKKISFPIYQNHFVAKAEIYKQYVEEFLDPAMEAMVSDVELMGLCWQDSRYSKLKDEPLSDHAKKQLGVSYYPMHPFLCERFFSCWIEGKKFNVQYI